MSEITLESQIFEIIKDKDMPERIKLAKVDMLVKLGADVNAMYGAKSALRLANEIGAEKVAEFLEENGVKDIFDEKKAEKLGLELVEECGCNEVNLEKVKELVEKGADVNLKDKEGYTALMNASCDSNKEIAEFLVAHGAEINVKGNDGMTALIFASRGGYKDIVELLVNNGADVNIKEKQGMTALMLASLNGHREIVEFLVLRGADVNAKDEFEQTALMSASFGGHKEIIEFLVSRGADINQKNNLGKTAIDLAKNEEVKGILNKKVQELAEEKNNSIFTKIKRGFGLGD